MILKIDTYLPLRKETEENNTLVHKLTSRLLEVSEKIVLPLDDFGETNVKIEVLSKEDSEKVKLKHPDFFNKDVISTIHFQSIVDYKEIFQYDMSQFPDWLTNESLNEATLKGIYRSRILNFLIFTQLSVPGSLYSYKGFYLTNNNFHMDFEGFNSCLIGLAFEDKPVWPFVRDIPLDKVWDYIIKKTNILTKDSETKIERGLNAFSYLFNQNDNSANSLFWSMTGVEALYADGEIGIGYQINNKSKLFLGEPIENKRILTKLYDYRSKFLHGKKSIPLNHGWLDGEYTDKHDEEFMDNTFISAKLLTVTLQKIIANDIETFEFEFRLIE